MKIALITSNYPLTIEKSVKMQISGLFALGHEIDVFAFHNRANKKSKQGNKCIYFISRYNPISFIYFPIILLKSLKHNFINVLKCFKSIKHYSFVGCLNLILLLKDNYDFILINYAYNAKELINIKRIKKDQGIGIMFHGSDVINQLLLNQEDIVLFNKYAEALIPVSKYLEKEMIKRGFRKEKIKQLYVSPGLKIFNSIKRKITSQVSIVTVASLNEIKGLDISIKAMSLLSKENEEFDYYIIGNGNEKKKISKLINIYNLDSHVKLTGILDRKKIAEIFSFAKIYLQPSINEGLGMALMEASAAKLIIVASNVGGIPEVILNNKTGYLYLNNDYKELYKKLKIVINNIEKSTYLGENAYHYVNKQFSAKRYIIKLENIMKRS